MASAAAQPRGPTLRRMTQTARLRPSLAAFRVLAVYGAIAAAVIALAVPRLAYAHVDGPSTSASRGATTTFRFENIPVRSALQFLAEEGGFNLVVSDSVQGTITLHLTDVTWEQALDVVLKLKGLEQHVDGGTRTVVAGG
jgi:type II secretory pathway component GspD/PulD (secretin)